MITLLGYCRSEYLREHWTVSADYAAVLCRAARTFEEWAGEPVPIAEVFPLLAGFLKHKFQTGQWNAITTNSNRQSLLALLRSAAEHGLCPRPLRLARLPEPHDEPEAWTIAEVSKLFEYCRNLPGAIGGIPKAAWWGSLFAVVYWTAERIKAVRQTRYAAYDPAAGTIRIKATTTKNGKGRLFRLPPHAMAKLAEIADPKRELLWPWPLNHYTLWPWPLNHYTLWHAARKIIERAGLPCPNIGHNLFHRLRRTNISYCAAADPTLAIAQRQAGHQSAKTTIEHYIAPAIAPQLTAMDVLPVPAY